jgi:hypothetical protein
MQNFVAQVVAAVMLIGLAIAEAAPAWAYGAIAVGTTGSIKQDGIAYGYSRNFPTEAEANERALKECREFPAASSKATGNCSIRTTFRNECYAVANDPKDGTPGTGWSVAADKETASVRALAACKASAGRDREQYGVVETSKCDGKND